jgi:hypothetical protein
VLRVQGIARAQLLRSMRRVRGLTWIRLNNANSPSAVYDIREIQNSCYQCSSTLVARILYVRAAGHSKQWFVFLGAKLEAMVGIYIDTQCLFPHRLAVHEGTPL